MHLKLRALDGIFDAAQDPAIREKKGEELVDALIESQKGNVISASRYRNNKRNDGANGEPQYQEFDENGTLRKAMHYNEGDRHNAADGSPGLAEFYPDGEVKTVIYYT